MWGRITVQIANKQPHSLTRSELIDELSSADAIVVEVEDERGVRLFPVTFIEAINWVYDASKSDSVRFDPPRSDRGCGKRVLTFRLPTAQ